MTGIFLCDCSVQFVLFVFAFFVRFFVFFLDMSAPDIVRLNVGGMIYTTSRSTLCKYPDSMLGTMFGGKFEITYDDAGCAFNDRDGEMFRHVLNFLRTGRLLLPKEFDDFDLLESEADFYQIRPLSDGLMEQKRNIIGRNTTLELYIKTKLCWEWDDSDDDEEDNYSTRVIKRIVKVIGRKDVIEKYINGNTKNKFNSNVVSEEICYTEPSEIRQRLVEGCWEYKGRSVTIYPVRRKNSQTYGERVSQETIVKTID